MIEFRTEVKELLPYDRKKYLSLKKWYGVSFQLPIDTKPLTSLRFIESYEPFFKNLIEQFDNDDLWIINHDYLDRHWFPNNDNTLPLLRNLFSEKNIPNSFTGALIFSKNELLKYATDLISYPHAVFNQQEILYNDIDISNSKINFIIKISGHLNIDLLSTDIELLKKTTNSIFIGDFDIKEYRGTKL